MQNEMRCGSELNIRCAMCTGDLHLNTFAFEKSCTFKQLPLTGTIQRQHQSVGLGIHQLHGAVFQLSGRNGLSMDAAGFLVGYS